ncbi:MAG TPA: shikimate kinase [Gemmatimonadales bacterium]|jgi:shikimate kinase|nr:shikimate kinase [Gemmatimonadales bacterium]
MSRHLILVGLPGSGKSTVGKLVADGLNAPLIDVDSLLIREMGMPVAQIFGMVGEPRFRKMEHDAVLAALHASPAVVVPGAGWAAQPGQLEQARRVATIIYLKCTATVASRRSGQSEARPLLEGGDPLERMRELLKVREPFYRLADYEVAAESGAPATVAEGVIRVATGSAGWSRAILSK